MMREPHFIYAEGTEPGQKTPEKFPETYAEAKELSDKVLKAISPRDRKRALGELRLLDNVGRFIGRDFDMPVLLTAPKAPWHWNSVENYVAIPADELLEGDPDENLWSIGHEASHRRITRNTANVEAMLHQPGGALLRNVIEDPRVNNYLSDNYSLLDRGMHHFYEAQVAGQERQAASFESAMGFVPRHDLASFEYIRLWYKDRHHEPVELSPGLPEEVVDVVESTLGAAQDAWWTYPTRKEADEGEEIINKYAIASGALIANKIWPEFAKLMEEDMQDAMTAKKMLEMIQEMIDGGVPEGFEDLPPDLQDMLKAIADMAKETNEPPKPMKFSELSEEQKQALRDFIAGLTEEEKQKLREEAKEVLDELDTELSAELDSQFEVDMPMPEMPVRDMPKSKEPPEEGGSPGEQAEEIDPDLEKYNGSYADVVPQITELYNNLNNIFIARKAAGYTGGYRRGSRLDIGRRMQEKAQGVSASQTHAWEKRELPLEKDYVVSILVDLSGSMAGGGSWDYELDEWKEDASTPINSAMKSAIVVAEALAKMNIWFEINGFNGHDFSFKKFADQFGNDVRKHIPEMEERVHGSGSYSNDDGWAVGEAAKRLRAQKASEKILVVLSDGQPAPSDKHSGPEYELSHVVQEILAARDIKVASIGIQSNAVEYYYPDYAVVNDITDLPRELSQVVQRLIEQA